MLDTEMVIKNWWDENQTYTNFLATCDQNIHHLWSKHSK